MFSVLQGALHVFTYFGTLKWQENLQLLILFSDHGNGDEVEAMCDL
jgi:hypothetical protein